MTLRFDHIVLWLALLVAMLADIVTTYTVLNQGGYEKNMIPAMLQQANIILWPVLLLLVWCISCRVDLMIVKRWKSDLGLILFPVPIMLEVYTVAGNIHVLEFLTST